MTNLNTIFLEYIKTMQIYSYAQENISKTLSNANNNMTNSIMSLINLERTNRETRQEINTNEIVSKVESFDLHNEVLLPKFEIPDEFIESTDKDDGGKRGENKYLRHLTFLGAEKRYGKLNDDLNERIEFELVP